MFKFASLFLTINLLSVGNAYAASDSDFLAKQSIAIESADADAVVNRTLDDLRGVFERYKVAIDSSSKIISPLKVSGPRNRPVLEVTIQKCVFVVCETVELDADIRVVEGRGTCNRNFNVIADLRRSSQRLTGIYDFLDVAVCFKKGADKRATLELTASAHHARTYQQGIIQKQIFDLLQLQIKPMTKALSDALKANQ